MEASALTHPDADGLRGPTPLLRLQSDERLVALTRRGHQAAYEALVARYQARLLAFCRHMLGSREDAEDVLQEVFAAAFNAMMADDRALNVRPWLYRIARNRSLNHLRRATAIGVDSMDVHLSEHGQSAADKVHRREEFRLLVADVQELAETQRTALLLREIDALSYEQIAEAMETTIPSVKSLLVRARVSLAEAAEARTLTCAEVRGELGAVAEGLARTTAPVRRHLRSCDRCSAFRKQLRSTNKALAAVFPVGPLLLFKKVVLAHLGTTASAGGSAAAAGAAGAGARRRGRRPRLRRRGRRGVEGGRRAGRRGDRHRGRRRGRPRHASPSACRHPGGERRRPARDAAAAPATPRVVASQPQAPSVARPAARSAATPKPAKADATSTTPATRRPSRRDRRRPREAGGRRARDRRPRGTGAGLGHRRRPPAAARELRRAVEPVGPDEAQSPPPSSEPAQQDPAPADQAPAPAARRVAGRPGGCGGPAPSRRPTRPSRERSATSRSYRPSTCGASREQELRESRGDRVVALPGGLRQVERATVGLHDEALSAPDEVALDPEDLGVDLRRGRAEGAADPAHRPFELRGACAGRRRPGARRSLRPVDPAPAPGRGAVRPRPGAPRGRRALAAPGALVTTPCCFSASSASSRSM